MSRVEPVVFDRGGTLMDSSAARILVASGRPSRSRAAVRAIIGPGMREAIEFYPRPRFSSVIRCSAR